MITFRVVGPGRAGRSFRAALEATGRYLCLGEFGRGSDVSAAADGVDLVMIATPDQEIASVARAIRPVPTTVVLHCSGSLGLGVLATHVRRGSLHPLVPLPNPAIGAQRLASGISFAVAGDARSWELAADLGGRSFEVADGDRDTYHAAAAVAANHLVALLGQVERLAATVGLPLDAFSGLVRSAVDDAMELGPRAALTGPAARGDWETVERHRDAIRTMPAPRTELAGYDAVVALARRLSLEPTTVVEAPRAHAVNAPTLPGMDVEEVA